MKVIAGLAGFLVVLLIAYSAWSIARKVNYRLFYKSMVEETVKGMVKEEALK